MYKCERLTKKKVQQLLVLNSTRTLFNSLNEDFLKVYDKSSFAEQIFLRNQIRLLKFQEEYIGYVWMKKYKKGHYLINALNIIKPEHHVSGGCFLLKTFKTNSRLDYQCEKNDFNFTLLPKLGFKKEEGTVELLKTIDCKQPIDLKEGISFESFLRGTHEEVRCKLQNEIFKNNDREPLTMEDIYFDVIQDYFWDSGSIFIKYNDAYIGYGQIILDGRIPTIVNFGIIKEFRSKGYGKLLLNYLLNILFKNGYKEARIRVNSSNILAYELYVKLGFTKTGEHYGWTMAI